MAYVLTLLAALSVFVFFTPAREGLGQTVADGAHAAMNAASSYNFRPSHLIGELKDALREKSMKLLREQLHEAIDESVK